MSTLFNDSETFQKERPIDLTEKQKTEFYLAMATELISKGFSSDDDESVAEDLEELYPFNDNGFELAKELEGYRCKASYEIDTYFCEWLDGLYSSYKYVVDKNVKDWVKAHNPQPKFEKGTKLLITESLCHGMGKGLVIYINGGRPEEAVYWLNTDPEKYGGTILPYEKVEKDCVIIN